MERKMYIQLQKDLAEAIERKDLEKIKQLRQLLNIGDEQAKYFSRGLTGYPSIDQVWYKYYPSDAKEKALNIPKNETVWDVIEKKLLEYYDVPALEYFGNTFSKQEFIDLCYTWARTFRALGIEENEIVPIYGPFVPDICAMFFALNMIGACPYFLKLAISKESLEEETQEARFAVVYDAMWPLVSQEFSKNKYNNIIIATATENMPNPKKEIVSFLNKIQSLKNKSKIPDEKKYIFVDKAKKMADYYTGNVKVPFEKNRNAVITSSSGTTGGIVKGVVATNESVISQVYSTTFSDIPYKKGFRTLNHFPPTASTSLNSLFLVPLMNGATVLIDPRVSIKDFYNQLVKLKPNICINTSSLWEAFFNKLSEEIKHGKKFNFEYAKGWMIGGEGTSVENFEKWNEIMQMCGASGIYGGYGLSETFSGISIDRVDSAPNYSKPIAGVGLIQAGIEAGVFDKDNNELSYNKRGELKVKAQSRMKEYYKKPLLTEETIIDDWIKTGDIAEIDDNGFLYVWGRSKSSIITRTGEEIFLFDIENILRSNKFLHDVVILQMPTQDNNNNLVAHIVWSDSVLEENKNTYIEEMNKQISEVFPVDIKISGYFAHNTMLPYSSTTLKKDRTAMSHQLSNYIQVINGQEYNVDFEINEKGIFIPKYDIIKKDKVRKLNRK